MDINEDSSRQQDQADGRLDPAVATLYRATVSFGTQETQLIWTRYAGFLVLNGFLITAYTQISLSTHRISNVWVLVTIGFLGLFFNAMWHILNFAGWQNQNLWYHRAATLSPLLGHYRLPTDCFKANMGKPRGWIYWLAQTVPIGLSIAATIGVLSATRITNLASWAALAISIGVWIVFAVVVLAVEDFVIARVVGNRPL